jgi:Ca2+-binding RTX toxin-like protein
LAEGTDTVESAVNYSLGENVENLTLTGSAEAGMGNSLNNILVGNEHFNKLFGQEGNDDLEGGSGADVLIGGLGNDKYRVDSSDDLVVETAAEGTDTVLASVSYALSENVENLTLIGAGDINAVGNAGNNRLEGNAGSNVLFGGLGNDTYVFGRGSGSDVVANFDAGKPSGDKIQLTAGIADADLTFVRTADDLVLRISGASDQLTVLNYFVNGGRGSDALERVRFSDGTSLNHAAVLARSTTEAEVPGTPSLPAGVRQGDASALYTAPNPAATAPSDAPPPISVAESIALARARFEQGLLTSRTNTDDQGGLSRSEFVERRSLPLLWSLQDALLTLQLANNADGRLSANASVDARMARDIGLAVDMLSAVPGASGRLDQVARPAQVQQFDLAQLQ